MSRSGAGEQHGYPLRTFSCILASEHEVIKQQQAHGAKRKCFSGLQDCFKKLKGLLLR